MTKASGSEKCMSVSVKLQHVEDLRFNVEFPDGRRVELNSAERIGQAFTPMELFLVSLGGCTAMDIQWIMSRQRQKLDRLEVSVHGTRREEDPRYYENIEVEYVLTGPNLKKEAVERAVRLSQEKYCSVRAMLNDSVKIRVAYTIVNGEGKEEKFTYAAPKA
jgi:putative redox protein